MALEAKYASLVDWSIKPGMAGAFESNRKALFELRKKHLSGRGWVSSRLGRFLGSPNRYMILNLHSSVEAFGVGTANDPAAPPEMQEFNRATPGADFYSVPNVQERFEVIQRV